MKFRPFNFRRPFNSKSSRRGVLTVEMAFVLPVILLFFFGMWEWSRVEMIRHICQNACFEGARFGTLPGRAESDTEEKVEKILDMYFVKGAIATASFDVATGASTVFVSIPVNDNFTVGQGFFADRYIQASMTLVQ